MFRNEKQLRNIVKKIINENYRRLLREEKSPEDEEDGDSGGEQAGGEQAGGEQAGGEQAGGEQAGGTQGGSQAGSQGGEQAPSAPSEQPESGAEKTLKINVFATTESNKDEVIEDLAPGQIKLTFKNRPSVSEETQVEDNLFMSNPQPIDYSNSESKEK